MAADLCYLYFHKTQISNNLPHYSLPSLSSYVCLPGVSLYSFQVINANGIHLQTVFERICDALGILITLDHIIQHQGTLREHWDQYKR